MKSEAGASTELLSDNQFPTSYFSTILYSNAYQICLVGRVISIHDYLNDALISQYDYMFCLANTFFAVCIIDFITSFYIHILYQNAKTYKTYWCT